MAINILLILLGFVFLIIGADVLVKGSSNIAKKFHIPEIIIGLTIVSIGTSMPELIITLKSAISGNTDLIVGNAIGSNLCNILLIIGLISLIRPVNIDTDTKKIHIPIALLATMIIIIMGYGFGNTNALEINMIEGSILLVLFVIYFTYPIHITVKDIIQTNKHHDENYKKISIVKSIFFIVIGIVLLKYGADFVVDNASLIAARFNISQSIIGLTIIAIGTALPELITSIVASIKKDTEMALGNLIGSCVVNLWLILGFGAVITPLVFSAQFSDLIFSLISLLFLWLFTFIGKKNTISRLKGFVLLYLYLMYMINLFASI